jgi:hypothetical protein
LHLGRQFFSSNCKVSTHVDWCLTNQALECLCADGDNVEDEQEHAELFDEFDEGDDLECDLAAALSTADRKAADANSLDFQEHVQQVGSSGLTVGPFRTPIEPCTSSNFNFNYSFGLCVAMDKIWLITATIQHLFGDDTLESMTQRFIRRWSGGVFANANTGAGKLLEHGMICGNPLRKKKRADEWYAKAKLIDPDAKYPMFQTPCGYIGEQSGHTLSCGHSCMGQLAIGQNATEKPNMPMRQAFLYCTALGIPGHFKPSGRQRCIKANAELYQLTYQVCKAGYNIFEHPDKFKAVLEPRMVILEFVVEAFLYTQLMVSRVNDTPFPYQRVYAQPTSTPSRGRGRGKGRASSQRGAGKGGAPKGSSSATPKRPAKALEHSSMQKKPKPAAPATNEHENLIKRMCEKSGLPVDQLLNSFVAKAPGPAVVIPK